MSTPIRIVLVDDHELIRESWNHMFSRDDRFQVIGLIANGAEAIELVKQDPPDIVLMDINMTPMNGLEATKRILELVPSVKIIGCSANNNPRYADRMLVLGAKGYVTKTSTFDELKTAIVEVMEGKEYVCEEIRVRRK
jgi:DNA-binding NarL/FixJ family response regulator